MGVTACYEGLSRLLFFSLPKFNHLVLVEVWLDDGNWGDIVEGLRHIVPLTSCKIEWCSQSDRTPYSFDSIYYCG